MSGQIRNLADLIILFLISIKLLPILGCTLFMEHSWLLVFGQHLPFKKFVFFVTKKLVCRKKQFLEGGKVFILKLMYFICSSSETFQKPYTATVVVLKIF